MADSQSAIIDSAARTAETVTTQAAGGNAWAFAVFVALLAAALAALWVWRSTSQGEVQDGEPKNEAKDLLCSQANGCPAVNDLSIQVDALTRQLEIDQQERRDHRLRVEEAVTRIHDRIDGQEGRFASQRDLDGIVRAIQHSIEEMSRTIELIGRRGI